MVDEYQVRFVSITDEMRLEARPRATFLAGLNHHSAAGEDNYLFAAIAEKAMADYLGATFASTPDYDFYFGNKEFTIDNKNITTTVPYVKPHFDAQVFDYNKTQNCHAYTWTRTMRDIKKPDGKAVSLLLVGWMGKEEFKLKKKLWTKGTQRIDMRNGRNSEHNYDTDTNVVLVSELHPLHELKALGEKLKARAVV